MMLKMSKIKWATVPVLIGIPIALLVYLISFRSSDRPNLVLIVIDTLRADHLGCYGYEGIRTPNIDEVAESGVRFENETSHVPITLPSLATIMTGDLPPTNGVHNNENYHLDDSALTLAEILREAGYRTGAAVGAMVLDSLSGISQGFDRYDDDFEAEYTGHQEFARVVQAQLNRTQRRAEAVTDGALGALDRMMGEGPGEGPFFLFVHYFDPHSPYDPPPPFNRLDPSVVPGSQEYMNRLYDGEIAYLDGHLGRLIRGLRERGLLENTLVVLTSDHGEGLGEKGEKTHAYYVYQGALHVPLIYSMPGRLPRGGVYRGLSRHIDILPTILDILDVEPEEGLDVQGRSLYPFDEGDGADWAYFETAMPYIMFGWSGLRGIRGREWKYIEAPREELYNLVEDPEERYDLITERPRVADSLRMEMDRILDDLEIYRDEGGGEVASVKGGQGGPGYRERLQALGYIGTPREMGSTYEEMFDRSLPDPKDKLDSYDSFLKSYKNLQLGIAFLRSDSLEAAVAALEKSVAQAPGDATSRFFLGKAYRRSGETDRAESAFNAALRIDSDFAEANIALSRILVGRGDSAAAMDHLERVLNAGKVTLSSLSRTSRLWERLGRADKAVEAMEEALEVDTNYLPARLYLAERSMMKEDYRRALEYLNPLEGEVSDEDSLSARVYYAMGRCEYREGDLVKAEEHFQRVISIDSTAAGGYNQLGLIYDDMKEYEKALSYYHRALRLDPGMVEVHSNLGVTYYKMGRYRESLEEFETYLPHAESAEEKGRLNSLIQRINDRMGKASPSPGESE